MKNEEVYAVFHSVSCSCFNCEDGCYEPRLYAIFKNEQDAEKVADNLFQGYVQAWIVG
jgi:hypothetical protein